MARDRADDEGLRRVGLGPLGVAPGDLWDLVVVAVVPILAIAKIRLAPRDAPASGVAR